MDPPGSSRASEKGAPIPYFIIACRAGHRGDINFGPTVVMAYALVENGITKRHAQGAALLSIGWDIGQAIRFANMHLIRPRI